MFSLGLKPRAATKFGILNEKMAEKENNNASTLLPLSRIRTIMKSSPDVSNISQEALFMIAKSTEHFVQELSQRSFEQSVSDKHVPYNALAEVVDDQEALQFLQDTIPKKITVREYYALMGKKDKFANDENANGNDEEET